ncbi:MAG: inositol monophosphatase, partial [Gemmatimonadetes bacterium]
PMGEPVDAPFNVTSDVAWIGYANERLRARVEPVLRGALRRRGLLP